MSRKRRVLVVLSGGMDSSTLLKYYTAKENTYVKAITFSYGQRHDIEIDYAMMQTRLNNVEHEFFDLDLDIFAVPLTGTGEIPEGHYTDESMKKTIVPNRNAILLSIAYGYAIAHDFDVVAYAAHRGDHPIYPDCREEFVVAISRAFKIGTESDVVIEAPFINKTKAEIVKIGWGLVDYRNTYSCYKGEPRHCGKCGTCVERKEAFSMAGVSDPTDYLE